MQLDTSSLQLNAQFPDWDKAPSWEDTSIAMKNSIPVWRSKMQAIEVNEIGTLTNSYTLSWGSLVVAPNGNLYSTPYAEADGLVTMVNGYTGAVSQFTPTGLPTTGNTYWNRGILGKDGLIYMPPYATTNNVLVYTPAATNCTASYFSAGNYGWATGVLAGDGCIYCPPMTSSRQVLKIDTDPDSAGYQTTSLVSITFTQAFTSAHLRGDGKIIFFNNITTTYPYVYDPVANTGVYMTRTGTQIGNSYGSAIDANGTLYQIAPDTISTCKQWNNHVYTKTQENNLSTYGIVLGPDGNMYTLSIDDADQIRQIDTKTHKVRLFGPTLSANEYEGYGALAPNGNIYMLPYNSTTKTVLEIDFGLTEPLPINFVCSPYINRF